MWYSASLLFKSERDGICAVEMLWEEQIVLIEAEDEVEAKQKATQYGAAKEHEYRNQKGESVRWVFKQIERVCEVDPTLKDGAEVFSRFLRESEVKSLLTPFD